MASAHQSVYEGVDPALVMQRKYRSKRKGVRLEIYSVACFIKSAKVASYSHESAEVARDGYVPAILIEGKTGTVLTVVLIAAKNLHLRIALRPEWKGNGAQEKYDRETVSHKTFLK